MDFDDSIEVPADQELQQWTLKLPARAGVYLLWGAKHKAILLATTGSVRASVRRKLSRPESEISSRRTELTEITKGVSWTQAGSNFVAYWQFHQLARAIYPSSYDDMLGWSDAWWVRISLSENFGRLLATRKLRPAGPDEYVGPFANSKAAKYFIDLATDMYGLCRDYDALRQGTGKKKAPMACAYAQMGQCCGACLGRVSAARYREFLLKAIELAEPEGRVIRRRCLEEQMSRDAAKLEFESAARNKKLIKRMGKLDEKDFFWAGDLRRFKYLIIAPGPDRHHIWPWRVNSGTIEPGKAVAMEDVGKRAGEIVDWAQHADYQPPANRSQVQRWRESIGLLSYFLFRARNDKCLYYKSDHLPSLTEIAEQISGKFGKSKSARPKDQKENNANVGLKATADAE